MCRNGCTGHGIGIMFALIMIVIIVVMHAWVMISRSIDHESLVSVDIGIAAGASALGKYCGNCHAIVHVVSIQR